VENIQSRILRKSLLKIISYYIKVKNISKKDTDEKLLSKLLFSVNTIHFLVTEHLSGFDGDRDHPAMVEGEFTIGPETKRCGGRYSVDVADSGERAY